MSADDRLIRLVRDLEKSIEHAIASSPRVEQCLARVSEQGYEPSLLLQATLAFAARAEPVRPSGDEGETPSTHEPPTLSPTDKKFLRSLKIAIEEEGET